MARLCISHNLECTISEKWCKCEIDNQSISYWIVYPCIWQYHCNQSIPHCGFDYFNLWFCFHCYSNIFCSLWIYVSFSLYQNFIPYWYINIPYYAIKLILAWIDNVYLTYYSIHTPKHIILKDYENDALYFHMQFHLAWVEFHNQNEGLQFRNLH